MLPELCHRADTAEVSAPGVSSVSKEDRQREKHNMVSEVSLKTGEVRSCISTGSDTETNNSSDQTDRTTTLCSSVSSLLTTS